MTTVIRAPNINYALRQGLRLLLSQGIEEESRNGKVLVAPSPVMTIYAKPQQRVLFNPTRDANPFFHFMESLWMLAGRNDVQFVKHYASGMGAFSDDGKTLHGAYGYRWRKGADRDQLQLIIEELTSNPKSRRCVLQMWDASYLGFDDLVVSTRGGKDVPCNTHAYFDTVGGKLNMTVCCRSNDMVWGAYGANAVHFSFLLEYVALMAGLPIGEYRQFSNNFHMYVERPDVNKLINQHTSLGGTGIFDRYDGGVSYDKVGFVPLMKSGERERWNKDLYNFFTNWYGRDGEPMPCGESFETGFFKRTAVPMHNIFAIHKSGRTEDAISFCEEIEAEDWRIACQEWLKRRLANKQLKEQQ